MTTVLVVDDSAVDRRLVGGILQKKFPCTVKYAANGMEALARMKDALPDLVVTDLTMPAMDGLELVSSIRNYYPDVPVILMTAYGSESLAMRALAQGAASYVPKSQLADRLQDTMEEVLALAGSDRSHEQLLHCLSETHFRFALENDVALIGPLVNLIQQMVVGMHGADFSERLQIGVALKEALLNAIFHGNLEITAEEMQAVEETLLVGDQQSLVDERRHQPPYCERRIRVEVRIDPEEAQFIIRDEGPGFDVAAVPDPDAPGSLEPEGGRGLALMRAFMAEVKFNDRGNEVTMVRRRNTARRSAVSHQQAGSERPPI
jgi:CheY-like chemotaxis protein